MKDLRVRRATLTASTAILLGLMAINAPAFAQDARVAAQAPSQDVAAAVPADVDANKVAEIIVTGSAIPVSPGAVAVPVTIVGAQAIEKSGVDTNVLDILRKAVPAFGGRSSTGTSNASNNNQNTAGGSSIQIRNLDTLVLVNGRRVAVDSIAGVNGKVFVNVAEIPPAAIDRIEVLTDGASAIYGSEAIGGVVNIILKSNYEGGQIDARYGGAAGNYNEKTVDATYGFSPFHGTNITASATYSTSSPLFQSQRAFSSPFYSTSTAVPGAIGNFFLNPGITAPTPAAAATIGANTQYTNAGATIATAPGTGVGGTYNLAPFQMLVLQSKQKAAALTLNSDLTGDRGIELFGDFEYSQNDALTQWAPVTASVTVPAGSAFDPLTTATTVVFGSTANPKTYVTREKAIRGTLGLRGTMGFLSPSWTWEVGYTHSENSIDQTINNVIYTPNLALAAAGGYNSAGVATPGGAFSMVRGGTSPSSALVLQPALNPFATAAGVAAGALNNVLMPELIHGTSKLDTADAKVSGTIGSLPGGRPSLSVGGSWRKESINGAPLDPNAYSHVGGTLIVGATGTATGASQNLFTGGLVVDPFNASRTITSEYGELRVPVFGADWNLPGLYNFDLIGAIRHEHYSDFGDATVPKIGFRWQPIARQITIRGNFARSFTAPSLYQIRGPLNVASSAATVITNAFPTAIAGSSTQQSGSNPNLLPARSRSFSLGTVLKPDFIPRLTVDVDFSSVRETGQINGIGLNNILLDVNKYGSASQFYNNAAVGALPGTPGAVGFSHPGDVLAYVTNPANLTGGVYTNLYLKDVPTNLGLIDVRSLNVSVLYTVPLHDAGTLNLSSQAAILLRYNYQAIPGQPVYDFAGTTTQGGGAQGTLPRLRMYTTADWSLGHWGAGIANTYISSVSDIGTGGYSYFTNLATNPTSFTAGHVKSFMSWDLRVSFHTARDAGGMGFTLTAGINDLFNRLPPVSTNINPSGGYAAGATAWRSENNVDVGTYGAIGRLFYISGGFRF